MRSLVIRSIALVGAAVTMACGVDVATELERGRARLAADDFNTAAIHANNVIQADPGNAEARVVRGRAALALGDWNGARVDFERAVELGSPVADVGLDWTDALLRLGESARALEVLADVGGADDAVRYSTLRGEALLSMQRFEEAAEAFERSASLSEQESTRNRIGRGRLAAAQGRLADAEAILSATVADTPASPEAVMARGLLYLQLERLDVAAADLERAASLYAGTRQSPAEARVLSTLVQIYIALNETSSAIRSAERLSERFPNGALARYAEALVAYEDGRFDDALALLRSVTSDDARDAHALILLGVVHLALGNLGQSEQQLLNALAVAPGDPAAHELLAEVRIRQRRPEAALESLGRLTDRMMAGDSQLAALRGVAMLQAGQAEQAAVYLEQALADAPGDYRLLLELARAYIMLDRAGAAVELLEERFSGTEQGAEFHRQLLLLMAHARAGDLDAGRRQAEALVAEHPDSAQTLTAVAMYNQLLGRREEVRAYLERAVAADTDYVLARLLLAGQHLVEDEPADAERELRVVLSAEPGNLQASVALARVLTSQGQLREAEEWLTRAVEETGGAEPRLALARFYVEQRRIAEARRAVEAAADRAPDNVEVAAVRGAVELAAGRPAEATAAFRRAVELAPARVDLGLALAESQLRGGDVDAARDTLARLLEAASDPLPVRAALGRLELRAGSADRALEIAGELEAQYPEQAEGALLDGEARLAQRQYAAAARSFGRAFAREPTWTTLSRETVALQLAGDAGEVEPKLRAWLDRRPADGAARLALAMELQRLDRIDEALESYGRVLEVDPDNVVALNNTAWLLHEHGRPGALELAERALAAAPEHPAVLDTLGWMLVGEDRAGEGLSYLERAARGAPDDPDIQYHLGVAQARLGRTDAARATLERLERSGGGLDEQRAEIRELLEAL